MVEKKSIRSFTYIDDVVYSINLLIKKIFKKKYNECINIGNRNKNSLYDLIKYIRKYYSNSFKEKNYTKK